MWRWEEMRQDVEGALQAWQERHWRPLLNRRAFTGQLAKHYHHLFTMSSIRLSRAALRARSAFAIKPIQRRSYADAVSDKIKLSLALPHSVCTQAEAWKHSTSSLSDLHGYLLTLCVHRLFTNRPMCTNFSPSVHYRIVLLGTT